MSLLRNLFGKKESEPTEKGPLYNQVREAMTDVQAYARSHGGRIHLMGVTDDGEVKIKMTGTCDGCPMSDLTMKLGIEAQLRALVPGVTRVSQVG
jgi:Fe-S cluster biogenesis protein NfuA